MCDIWHTVCSDEPFAIRECNINGYPDQGVCDIGHTVHSDELFSTSERNRRLICTVDLYELFST